MFYAFSLDRLEAEGVCSEEKLPSVSSINRIVRSNKRYDGNGDSDDDGEGDGDYENSDETSMGSEPAPAPPVVRSSRSPAKKPAKSKAKSGRAGYQQSANVKSN